MPAVTEPTWQTWGNGWRLVVPCQLGEDLIPFHSHVGTVVHRRDGRWDWFRKPTSKHWPFKNWKDKDHSQGVADTLDVAMARVEAGFRTKLTPAGRPC